MDFHSGIRMNANALLLLLLSTARPISTASQQNLTPQEVPVIQFTSYWHQLGPFAIGTRETEWGSDPLEREPYGGFQALEPDETSVFRSSLARNGTVRWSATDASSSQDQSSVFLSISFPDIDWDMMQSAYGWAGLQFQAWARGYFDFHPRSNAADCSLILHTKQLQEIWIDGEHYFGGDVYGYGKAPIIVHLGTEAKRHIVDVRAVNDIRMFGGRKPPRIDIELAFKCLCDNLSIVEEASVFPDIVSGKSAGRYASIGVRNNGESPLDILEIQSHDEPVGLKLLESVTIAPSQTRPIKLEFNANKSVGRLEASLKYTANGKEAVKRFEITLNTHEGPYTPHKYTYTHPSGIVSYGIIRPPSLKSRCEEFDSLPILLSLHGAGVDTGSDMSRNSFEALPDLCAFVIIPSGVTPWSGDDWHTWGLADVDSAVAAIPEWMANIEWRGRKADLVQWFCAGHSNGGQGSWYTLIHRNDKAIGGSPISGYLSIQGYVPYVLWHELEPRALSVLQSSMNTYRLDLLVDNLEGIPILQGHGESDDNVPVFHSRRMFELLQNTVRVKGIDNPGYNELPKTGHWFDGIMTYGKMGDFLSKFFARPRPLRHPRQSFTLVVGNPGAMAGRGGFRVLQLSDPGIFGRMRINTGTETGSTWIVSTNNIRRFELDLKYVESRKLDVPNRVVIDGYGILIPSTIFHKPLNFVFQSNQWGISEDNQWQRLERYGSQLSGLQTILNTKGAIKILTQRDGPLSEEYGKKSTEISRNLFQYYSADTEIGLAQDLPQRWDGNVVVLGKFHLSYIPTELRHTFPISQSEDGGITFKLSNGETVRYTNRPAMGMIFVFPIEGDGRVGILIWGSDAVGLRRVTRLFPIRTGVSQPDFIVLGGESGWKGAAGALALGMFDSKWQIQPSASFFGLQ
ncbi:hypothetical protein TWF281_005618 [Arthrobotrys megalospora]